MTDLISSLIDQETTDRRERLDELAKTESAARKTEIAGYEADLKSLVNKFGPNVLKIIRSVKLLPENVIQKISPPMYSTILGAFDAKYKNHKIKTGDVLINRTTKKDLRPGVLAHEIGHAVEWQTWDNNSKWNEAFAEAVRRYTTGFNKTWNDDDDDSSHEVDKRLQEVGLRTKDERVDWNNRGLPSAEIPEGFVKYGTYP